MKTFLIKTNKFLTYKKQISFKRSYSSPSQSQNNTLFGKICAVGAVSGAMYYFSSVVGDATQVVKNAFPRPEPIIDGHVGSHFFNGYKSKVTPYATQAIRNFINRIAFYPHKHIIITGEPGSGKTVTAVLMAQENSKKGLQTTFIISGSSVRDMKNSLLETANRLGYNSIPKNEKDWEDLEYFIVQQCKLRGGNINIVVTCLRSGLKNENLIEIPLFEKFFPECPPHYYQDYFMPCDHFSIMQNVRFYISAGKPEVLEYLSSKDNFVIFDRRNLFKKETSFTVADFKERIEQQNLDILKNKVKSCSSEILSKLIKNVCLGNDRLVDMVTAYLNQEESESILNYYKHFLSEKQLGKTNEQIILEKTLSTLEKKHGALVILMLESVAPEMPAPQQGHSMELVRKEVAKKLEVDHNDHEFLDNYEKSALALESYLLIHSNANYTDWYSGLLRSQEQYTSRK